MGVGANRPIYSATLGEGLGQTRREKMTALEVAEVLRWMARTRASWQAAAGFAGRSQHDVRIACDPAYAARFGGAGPVTPKTEARPFERRVERPAAAVERAPPVPGRGRVEGARPPRDPLCRGGSASRDLVAARRWRLIEAVGDTEITSIALAGMLRMTMPALQADLAALVGRGWLQADRSGQGRVKFYSLTDAAREALAKRRTEGGAG